MKNIILTGVTLIALTANSFGYTKETKCMVITDDLNVALESNKDNIRFVGDINASTIEKIKSKWFTFTGEINYDKNITIPNTLEMLTFRNVRLNRDEISNWFGKLDCIKGKPFSYSLNDHNLTLNGQP